MKTLTLCLSANTSKITILRRFIQKIPGYNSSKTTEIYINVSTKSLQNIKSHLMTYNLKILLSDKDNNIDLSD